MKIFTITILSIFVSSAYAEESLKEMKAKANTHFTSYTKIMNDAKDCIDDAESVTEFKACKYDLMMAKKMQEMKMKDEMKMK